MSEHEITHSVKQTSLRSAARTAGIGLLILVVTVIAAEFLAFQKIIVWGHATETVKSLESHRSLFLAAYFGYLVSFICDVVVAWALYVLLKPVNKTVSMLAGWFRVVYAVIALVALANLLTTWHLLSGAKYLNVFGPDQLHAQIMASIYAFRNKWDLAFPFFSIHIGLVGYLILKSDYVPRTFGILLILAGVGYLVEYGLKPLLFPDLNTDLLMVTFFGELFFLVWLLIWGSRIREPVPS